ncbi:MAG: hypothetical protein EXR72_08770 [Myxococcales bacterium]|nr:hypothetical protein [Myxococcales bacterium]
MNRILGVWIAVLSLSLLSGCAARLETRAMCTVGAEAARETRRVRALCTGRATASCYGKLGEAATGDPLARCLQDRVIACDVSYRLARAASDCLVVRVL